MRKNEGDEENVERGREQKRMNRAEQVDRDGYGIVSTVLDRLVIRDLIERLNGSDLPRSRAGVRHLMKDPLVAQIAAREEMIGIAREIVGAKAWPFRATLFDKSPSSNWLVAWHQDTALPLRERREQPGWGPWSIKEGVNYAHAPREALEQVVALRLHLDDSNESNGPLRVLPGTHKSEVLTDEEVLRLAEGINPVERLVTQGGVVIMRPLVIHASSKAISEQPRRVLHIEYAATGKIAEMLELIVA
jgi:ectoine hydroxylase-related dioxygenase (phytanoyl-CoA dioxygenase family)